MNGMDHRTFVQARRDRRERLSVRAMLFLLAIALCAALVLWFAGAVQAETITVIPPDREQVREERHEMVALLAALAVVDYRQSVELFSLPENYELNPLLGSDPSHSDMAAFGLAGVGAVVLLERIGAPDLVINSIVETERINIQMNADRLAGERRATFLYMLAWRW